MLHFTFFKPINLTNMNEKIKKLFLSHPVLRPFAETGVPKEGPLPFNVFDLYVLPPEEVERRRELFEYFENLVKIREERRKAEKDRKFQREIENILNGDF